MEEQGSAASELRAEHRGRRTLSYGDGPQRSGRACTAEGPPPTIGCGSPHGLRDAALPLPEAIPNPGLPDATRAERACPHVLRRAPLLRIRRLLSWPGARAER